jgi:hypothetical protein
MTSIKMTKALSGSIKKNEPAHCYTQHVSRSKRETSLPPV